MSKIPNYFINIIGYCRTCICDADICNECDICKVLICNKHITKSSRCKLCEDVSDKYIVCIICDNYILYNVDEYDGYSESMAFSDSYARCTTEVYICDYCKTNHLNPLTTNIMYQTYESVLSEHGGVWLGGPSYNLFRSVNETNYKLIQTCRKKIITYYQSVIHKFILSDIAKIIIEYCSFARDIVFVPYHDINVLKYGFLEGYPLNNLVEKHSEDV